METSTTTVQPSNRPVHEIRFGSVRVAIWANRTASGAVWFNATVVRRFREHGVWRESASLGRDDLPQAAKALELAYGWIWDQPEKAPTTTSVH